MIDPKLANMLLDLTAAGHAWGAYSRMPVQDARVTEKLVEKAAMRRRLIQEYVQWKLMDAVKSGVER